MEDHNKCLEDIEAAMMFGYPEDMQYKLMDRKGRCLLRSRRDFEAQEALEMASLLVQKSKLSSEDKLKFKQDIKNSISTGQEAGVRTEAAVEEKEEVQVRFDPHPCIPGLSAKLEVRHEAGRGRHSVAVTEIAPGEAVCEDSPVTWCLSHNHARTHCHHCCRGLAGARAGGYPSPLSRSETVVFCSLACLQEAASSYHRHEAALPLSHIFSIEAGSGTAAVAGAGGRGGYDEISGAVMMAVRVITQNTAGFFTSKDWLAGARQSHVPAEVCDDDDREYRYRALFNMVTHHEDRGDVDLLSTTMKSVFILQLLETMGFCSLRDNLATLGPVIFHLLEVGLYNISYRLSINTIPIQVIQYNSHPLDSVLGDRVDPGQNVQLVEVGSAVYPSLATSCNHSCDPATLRITRGNKVGKYGNLNTMLAVMCFCVR